MFARMWFVMPFDILERSIGEIWSQPRDKHFFFCWTLFVNVSLYTFKKLLIVDNCWCHENRCFDIIYSIVSWCELSLENSSKLCYEALIKSRATEEYNLDVEYQQIIYLWRSDDSWLMSRFNLKRFFCRSRRWKGWHCSVTVVWSNPDGGNFSRLQKTETCHPGLVTEMDLVITG